MELPNWDDLVLTHPDYSFFHSSAWARVLSESYGYKPLYFTSIQNGNLRASIPVMEIKSFITGKRGVSLPFTDSCPPLIANESDFEKLLNEVLRSGQKARWKSIEWRGGKDIFKEITPSSSYYAHTLDLTPSEPQIFSNFRDSTRRNIKKAAKDGVKVSRNYTPESLNEFSRLNCMTRKLHGLPPQPHAFFKQVYNHIVSRKKGFVLLAKYHRKAIAGAVFFHFGKKAIYKYGASDRSYQRMRPNNLIMWEAIKSYAQNGYKSLSFGRTEPKNEGLLQFKRGWGTREETINYYKYNLIKAEFVKTDLRPNTAYNILKRVPSPILNLAGTLLYRHAG